MAPRTIELDEFPGFMEALMAAAVDELYIAGKVEGGIELADIASHTQRYRTGRAAKSTTVTGRHATPFDPGPAPGDAEGFYLAASRTELTQAAESTIPHDPPHAPAHVLQEAGTSPEGKPYPLPFLEPRYHTFRRAEESVDRAEATMRRRSDKRATRALKARGVL